MKCQIYEKVDDASCGENIFRVQWIYEANLDFSQMCTFAEGPCRQGPKSCFFLLGIL